MLKKSIGNPIKTIINNFQSYRTSYCYSKLMLITLLCVCVYDGEREGECVSGNRYR